MELDIDLEDYDTSTEDVNEAINVKDTRSKAQRRLEGRRKLEKYREERELEEHLNEVWWDLDYPRHTD
ncbi:MAG: PA3496 family putative envelope integrity protein [bacterium]